MSITYQAPDALLHVLNPYLKGGMWGDRVYSKFAPASVMENFDLWVVCRVISDVPADYRADRDNRMLGLAVQAVSKQSAMGERASAEIYDLLHLSGVNDTRRSSVSVGVHSEWTFLSVVADRVIRLVPNKQLGTRFFENGYVFNVSMEAQTGYG